MRHNSIGMAMTRVAASLFFVASFGLSSAFAGATGTDTHGRPQRPSAVQTSQDFSRVTLAEAAAAEQLEPGLHVIASDERGITLELYTPTFGHTTLESGECDLITVPGYGETETSGWPRLPVKGAMVGIPPSAQPVLTVLERNVVELADRYELCPVPRFIFGEDPFSAFDYRGTEAVRDVGAYAIDGLYPASVAELATTGFVRSQRVAQVRFHPFQYNPTSWQLRHYERIRVRIDFGAEGTLLSSAGVEDEGGDFEHVLRASLLNYDAAIAWRASSRPRPNRLQDASQTQAGYKLLVDKDGIYQVTYGDLQAAGVNADSLDPRTLQLHNQGQQVTIRVTGEGDGSFDPGDLILFYGQAMTGRYTDVNVYWLTFGDGDGDRMRDAKASPTGKASQSRYFEETFRWEEDEYYLSSSPGGAAGDRWYAGYVYANGVSASGTYTFELHNIDPRPYDATVRGYLYGASSFAASPDHHVRVYLNGHLVDDVTWDGKREHTFESAFPNTYLVEGTNNVRVECPLDLSAGVAYDLVYVNWFEIDYRDTHIAEGDVLGFSDSESSDVREIQVSGFTTNTIELFDITAPLSPTCLVDAVVEVVPPIVVLGMSAQSTGVTYRVRFEDRNADQHHYLVLTTAQRLSPMGIERDTPSALRSVVTGADYVVITHGDFVSDVMPLVEHRADQGLRAVVVDVQDIYDEFNYGIFDPEAIRDFLAYAYANWEPPAPSYVLLVGDGNYDFKDNRGWGEPNFVPPYLAYVDRWIGEVAADNRYVCVSGDDVFPDMHLGRLPVKTSAEASAVVDKILSYENSPPEGDWNQQVLFVADNPDNAGNFYHLSDRIADGFLPAPYSAQKVYYKLTHPTVGETRTALANAINEGRLLVNYVGHAGTQGWASEYLFGVKHVPDLANAGRLPLMVAMSCLDGYYTHPSPPDADYSSTAETVVRASGKGAVASWSATGLGTATAHDYLNKGLFEAIFANDVIELGPATTLGKLYLYSRTSSYMDQIDMYTLFGDPALRLAVAKADVQISQTVSPLDDVHPGEPVTYTLAYSNAGSATAHHVTITDVLPTALLTPTVISSGAVISTRLGSRLAWDAPDLVAGEGGLITITGFVSPTFFGVLSNTATIATTSPETDWANNVAGPAVTAVSVPDLSIEIEGPTKAMAGSMIVYSLVYSNAGNALASEVIVSHVLPSVFGTADIIADVGTASNHGDYLTWSVGDLAPGTEGRITITVVLLSAPSDAVVCSAAIGTADDELELTNNVAQIVLEIVPASHRVFLPIVLRQASAPPSW
jgi:uncharacterized repeat protein (TIGR01451 family)